MDTKAKAYLLMIINEDLLAQEELEKDLHEATIRAIHRWKRKKAISASSIPLTSSLDMHPPKVEHQRIEDYTLEDLTKLQEEYLFSSVLIPAHCTECGAHETNAEPDLYGGECSQCGGEVKSILVIKGLI